MSGRSPGTRRSTYRTELLLAGTDYVARIDAILRELGVPPESVTARGLPLQVEAAELELVRAGDQALRHSLIPAAAQSWRDLHAAASDDGIVLTVVSAHRSLEKQAEIIRAKLARGVDLGRIFAASAPPGYSEHHTGRAIDVGTPGAVDLEEEFESTPAFEWLTAHAARFGFSMSYPRGNPHGFIYEPWHWLHRA
jgi:D-alanyl-D-alanine carboxypeptidase